jgi:hypothetical protein
VLLLVVRWQPQPQRQHAQQQAAAVLLLLVHGRLHLCLRLQLWLLWCLQLHLLDLQLPVLLHALLHQPLSLDWAPALQK